MSHKVPQALLTIQFAVTRHVGLPAVRQHSKSSLSLSRLSHLYFPAWNSHPQILHGWRLTLTVGAGNHDLL